MGHQRLTGVTIVTTTIKRKAEIKVIATFVVSGELTDAKWKKLVGDYFEPTGD